MPRTRLLLVDDSALFIEALSSWLAAEPEIDIVGVARDGREAIDMAQRLLPDIIMMDVLMPVMDGLEAIERIMASRPTPILVMTSDPRGESGELSIEALARGALDLVQKPTQLPISAAQRRALVDKLKFLASVSVVRHIRGHRHRWRRDGSTPPAAEEPIETRLVAIAASTGGPSALAQILGALPFDFGAAVLVVQHMGAAFAEAFCAWLDHASALEVRLAQHGERPVSGLALVAPPGRHMLLSSGGRIRLVAETRGQAHVPSADVLFQSLAAHAPRTTAVVLTGMGSDGAEGLLELRRAGAVTLVQDPSSSIVDGMPAAARRAGAAREVLALSEIRSRAPETLFETRGRMSWRLSLGELVERRLGICLRLDAGSEWIRRFVSARAEALDLSDAAVYVDKLSALPTQHDEWRQLIFVVSNGQTAFFRDAAQLELVGEILEDLARERGAPIHVWSAGCATGEEPYSIAMIAHARQLPVRVLGTDINEEFLERAARSRYGSWSLRRMPEEWRELYLHPDGDGFVVDERVRSMVSFARHNLTEAGPPLPPGRRDWDVVLCRNVFIYFAPKTIQAALTHMSGVLAPHGWLFLGASEGLVTDVPSLAPLARHGRIGYRHDALLSSAPSSQRTPKLPPPRVTVPTLVELPPESVAPPVDVADDLYSDAAAHIERGHFDRAVQLLEELVKSEPDHVRGRITLGNVLLSQHHFDRAAEAYAEAQALAPLVAEVHYFQGVLHRKTRELEPAAAAFRRALFLDDTFWPAAYQHASVLQRLGRLERSRAELGHALRALEKSGRRLPFHSQVSGLSGLCDPPERVAEACRSQLAAHAGNS